MESEWPVERFGHVSVAIGKLVLVLGGYTENQGQPHCLPPNEVWIYNTEINKWMRQTTFGGCPQGLAGAQAVYLSSERAVYIIGGFNVRFQTSDVFRLDTMTWTSTCFPMDDVRSMPSPRDKFSAWEFEDRIYIFGGYGPDCHRYMHDNGTFLVDSSSPPSWFFQESRLGCNNQLLIFNTESETWSNPKCSGCVPSPRAAHGVARIGHEAFLFGGESGDDVRLNDFYSLNLVTLEWTQIIVTGDVPVGRSWHALTAVSDRRICLFGGSSTTRTLGDAWHFDRLTLRWSLVNMRLQRPRYGHTAVCTSDENIVVFGGCSSNRLSDAPREYVTDLLVFRISPKTLLQLCLDAAYSYKHLLADQWSNLPCSLSRILLARCSLPPLQPAADIEIFEGGGVKFWSLNPEEVLDIYLPPNEVWLYNTEINKWMRHTTTGDLPDGLSGAQAVYLPSERAVYVICGFRAFGHTNEVYRLDAVTWAWSRIEIDENRSKPSPRDKFSAWEFEDRIYIFGGYGPAYHAYMHENGSYFADYSSQPWQPPKGWNNQLLIFSTEFETWSNPKCSGCVPSPRAAHGVARIGHEAFLFGGRHDDVRLNDLYSLNLVTLDWTQIIVTGDVPVGRSWHALTAVSDRRICLFGGYTTARETLGDAWYFDRLTLRWSLLDLRLLRPRLWHTAVCTSDENIVVFGGCSSDILSNAPTEHTSDLLVFRISTKTLLQLCLDAVYSYRHLLADQWSNLPRSLSRILLARCNPPLLQPLN